ncbi:uncharacterized protein BDZ99DRAFT_395221 [Mytilinidion resinicola]|uniref:GRF-type domain-containing protein n=1 Tax=Mytilinidion resinicola TaxID=574789 RepID=A0A6A6YBA8_9PEZI|nr:uncharacterized protein BDZ99DRAFT_395221 [Mytilinidion resinicola]KAF2806101.1 hypothetical protein BDZ99DRAFT_395221 [Mytilinidion resinicola]
MSNFRGTRKGGKARPSHSYATMQKGLFEDGTWKCDCNPRLPAIHLQTKKETANKGRWFYKCQKGQDDEGCCNFFLWEDAAKPREGRAVLGTSRTEPATPVTTPRKPGIAVTRAFTPSDYGLPQHEDGNKKRGRIDEEEDYGWDDSIDSVELARLGKQYDTPSKPPETPRKAVKTDVFTTPNTSRRKLPWLENSSVPSDGLPTPTSMSKTFVEGMGRIDRTSPASVVSNASYVTAGSERQKEIMRGYTLPMQVGTPTPMRSSNTLAAKDTTPTPSRFRDVEVGEGEDCQLIADILGVLNVNNVTLNESAKEGVRRVLNKHDLRMQGIIKGREISRLAIKAKDSKITELGLRISTLEAELETEKALVQHFKWKADNDLTSD